MLHKHLHTSTAYLRASSRLFSAVSFTAFTDFARAACARVALSGGTLEALLLLAGVAVLQPTALAPAVVALLRLRSTEADLLVLRVALLLVPLLLLVLLLYCC
jgi:hypothetical protein